MRIHIPPRTTLAALLGAAALAFGAFAFADDKPKTDEEPVPKFDAAYMTSAEALKAGEEVWQQQCRHCHGNSAYPGKAPKLNPGSYDPEFIWDRVTYGFRKMPPWKEVFSTEQRRAVVAYIKSDRFSP